MQDINKLIRRSVGTAAVDSLKNDQLRTPSGKGKWGKALGLLKRAEDAWNNMDDFRRQRARALRFCYGDQWADTITIFYDGEKKTMTMREYLALEGHIPMQANQIASTVNTITGVLVKEQNEPICNARDRDEQQYGELITTGLQANCTKNKMNIIYKLCTKDFVTGGLGCVKERYGYQQGREDSWTEYVSPNFLILETTLRDPRFWDTQLVGCWYEMPFKSLAAKVVKEKGDLERLEKIYPTLNISSYERNGSELTDEQDLDNITFMRPTKNGYCAVAELWTLETKERIRVHDTNEGTLEVIDADDKEMLNEINAINRERKSLAKKAGWAEDEVSLIETEYFIDEYWYCRLVGPDGTVFWEEESPYPDRMHPFTIMATPFIDGRISAYIGDAIDLQIAMNRALVLQDWIARNQIKGFTMIPQELVPDSMTNSEFVQNAMHLGNTYFYDSEKLRGAKPEVFHAGAVSYDATNFISQLKSLMESSTAVSGALQGKTPYSGTSATLYAQQTMNSSTPLAALLEDVRIFMEDVSTKKCKNIAAFYDAKRWSQIAGNMANIFDNANLNLNDVADIEFDLAIHESTSTPVYRAIQNDQLLQFFQMGAIDLSTMLEVGAFPFGDELLQKIQARQAEMEAAQNGQMGEAARQTTQQIDNPVETEEYGLPIKDVPKPLVQ